MYPALNAQKHPHKPAFTMAATGETVSYAELDQRSNRFAQLLRAQGLQRLGHYAVFMENNNRYLEACAAGERSGLYYTCINGYLTADELAYILNNCEARVLVTSAAKLEVARAALAQCPNVSLCLVVGAVPVCRARPEPPRCKTMPVRWPLTRPHPLRMRRWVRPCCIRRVPPDGPRASCARCHPTHRASRCHFLFL